MPYQEAVGRGESGVHEGKGYAQGSQGPAVSENDQGLAGERIDHVPHPELAAVMRPVLHEAVGSDARRDAACELDDPQMSPRQRAELTSAGAWCVASLGSGRQRRA